LSPPPSIPNGAGSWYYKQLAGLDRAPDSRSWQRLVIAPPGDADTLSQLSFASASIDTTMGLAAASWDVSGGAYPGAVCGSARENSNLTLTCAGGVFSGITFASYGRPLGSCAAGFALNASCDSAKSRDVVSAACLGKASCTLSATTAAFGGEDPCQNVVKDLSVVLSGSCKGTLYTLATTVPVGGTAQVIVPAMGAAAAASINEGAAAVWRAGAFVPGTPGITAAAATADGSAVAFAVGSGSYIFTVIEA
jgi:hypothetical protein